MIARIPSAIARMGAGAAIVAGVICAEGAAETEPDPFAGFYGNTVISTMPDGERMFYFMNRDGTWRQCGNAARAIACPSQLCRHAADARRYRGRRPRTALARAA